MAGDRAVALADGGRALEAEEWTTALGTLDDALAVAVTPPGLLGRALARWWSASLAGPRAWQPDSRVRLAGIHP